MDQTCSNMKNPIQQSVTATKYRKDFFLSDVNVGKDN